ncbi:DUF2786 domain-containing protein [Dietzia timorensis]|uniref:Gene 77 protein n=1 Tax=Dietzia timorensis TaxID=499555 RepID=A0A173LMM4_9ACTN|nr:DUF2786 domain-containing protein [Dietzia timorensis]ANI92889.1 Gene 77 protein [Dietzia timorensis]
MALKSSTKDKIRKLLAQSADRSVGDAESELFRAKAFELMAREGLAEADIGEGDTGSEVGVLRVDMNMKYGHEYGTAFGRIAAALHCSYTYGKFDRTAVIFGRRTHLDRLEFLWPLLVQICTTHMIATRGYDSASTRRKRMSFLYAFMTSVAKRLNETEYSVAAERERERAAGDRASTELAFTSDRDAADAARDQWLIDNGYVLAGRRRSRARLDRGASDAGMRAGSVVDIGNARLDGGPKQISA